ncbi:MAG: sulfhydrogenase 1 subunit delta [Candidatus Woesearchaeota archaeon]
MAKEETEKDSKIKETKDTERKTENTNKKLKVGVFSFTSCSGCQLIVINARDLFGDVFELVELLHLPLIQENKDKEDTTYDIVFIEGAVTKEEQMEKLMRLRNKTKYLVAFGTCATFGGVCSIKDLNTNVKETKAYKDFSFLDEMDVFGIDKYVKVDYYIRGCPPIKDDFLKLVISLSQDKIPEKYDNPVCIECRKNKNPCLLAKKLPCFGPVTYGGCNALCTSKGIACYGCRGPVSSPNVDRLVKMFKLQGISNNKIKDMFMTFAGTTKGYQDYFSNKDLFQPGE